MPACRANIGTCSEVTLIAAGARQVLTGLAEATAVTVLSGVTAQYEC
jgi:hypothetical protein